MKDYVLITVIKGSNRNAGPKAPRDIDTILKETGKVETVLLESKRHLDYPLFLRLIEQLKRVRAEGRKAILQYPLQPFFFFEGQELFKEAYSYLDPERTVLWVHDINKIRFPERPECRAELAWLQPFRHFIVHNKAMEAYLREHLSLDSCIRNEMFDYIVPPANEPKGRPAAPGSEPEPRTEPGLRLHPGSGAEPQLAFAGNLIHEKSPFLYELEQEKMRFRLNVYGKREELIKNAKICYRGNFNADLLPRRLCGDLGLIWDGALDSLEVNAYKNYTRYNAPHKFSCYMAAGLPVVAWREAAIAEAIRKYRVGYLIDSLYEINGLDLSRYEEFRENARALGQKVQSGYFTKQVFAQIEGLWDAV